MTLPPPAVVSVQSHVAYGHVGGSAAVFALQRLGLEVWPVQTCHLSNHTGYPSWRGRLFSAGEVADVLDGLAERGVLSDCAGVISGYLARAEIGTVLLEAVARARAAAPGLLYLCDPVMGDDMPDGSERLYAAPEIPAFLRARMVPVADILTPNRFELALLAEQPAATPAQAMRAARALVARGPRMVVVTSVPGPAAADVACLVVTAEGAWQVTTPRIALPQPVNGAGDALAALFLGHVLCGAAPPEALSRTVSALHAVIAATAEAGTRELQLIAAQDALVTPPRLFAAEAVA